MELLTRTTDVSATLWGEYKRREIKGKGKQWGEPGQSKRSDPVGTEGVNNHHQKPGERGGTGREKGLKRKEWAKMAGPTQVAQPFGKIEPLGLRR